MENAANKKRKESRLKLTGRHIELMMTILIRNSEAFVTASQELKSSLFADIHTNYRVLWEIVSDYYETDGSLPEFEFVATSVENRMEADPGLMSDDEYEKLSNFLDFAYGDNLKRPIEGDRKYHDWALRSLSQYVEEQVAVAAKKLSSSDSVISDLPAHLRDLTVAVDRLQSLEQKDQISYPDTWEECANLDVFATEIPFFDEFLCGGHAPKEVYGLMGPFGSCKTTIAVMLAVEAAKHYRGEASCSGTNGKPKLAFIVSYEAALPEMRNRALSYAAKVNCTCLQRMKNGMKKDLSHTGRLRSYERAMFAKAIRQGKRPLGEYERARETIPWLNDHLVMMDMTGADDYNRQAGNGGPQEIAARITRTCRQRGAECGMVVIDYVGAMIKRYMSHHNISTEQLRHLVAGAPLDLKKCVATPHDCPVWLMHQLSGSANSIGPGGKLDHTDAAESKSFGENLDFCFIIHKPDERNMCRLSCSKHRRTAGHREAVVRIEGALSRVISMNGIFVYDNNARKIVSVEEGARLSVDTSGQAVEEPSESHITG
jgi:RecA/RadA recombinase